MEFAILVKRSQDVLGKLFHQLLLCLVLLPRQDLHGLDSLLYVVNLSIQNL